MCACVCKSKCFVNGGKCIRKERRGIGCRGLRGRRRMRIGGGKGRREVDGEV